MASSGVCRAVAAQSRGLLRRIGAFPGDGEGLSEDDGGDEDDDVAGNEDFG